MAFEQIPKELRYEMLERMWTFSFGLEMLAGMSLIDTASEKMLSYIPNYTDDAMLNHAIRRAL